MSVQAYPLQWPAGWPRTPPEKRERARFGKRNTSGWGSESLTVAQARARLMEEINRTTRHGHPWRIPPDSVVISTNMPTRLDGMPRSGARAPEDPAVAVYFTIDGQDRVAPCDKWDRVADNIAAVAKTLEADRGKERWGVSTLADSYKHPALPGPDEAGGGHWSDILGTHALSTDDEIRAAYRTARRNAHPDAGGSSEAFNQVQTAWEQAKQERTELNK